MFVQNSSIAIQAWPKTLPHFGQKNRKPVLLKPVGSKPPVTVDEILTQGQIRPAFRSLITSIVQAHQRTARKLKLLRPKTDDKQGGLSLQNREFTLLLQTLSRLEGFLGRSDLGKLINALPSAKLRYIGSGADAVVFHAPRQKHVVKIRKIRAHVNKDYLLPGAEDLVWQPKTLASIPAKGLRGEDIEYVVERQLLTKSTGITDADREALNQKTQARGFVVYDDHPANYGRRGRGAQKQVRFIDVECVLKDD